MSERTSKFAEAIIWICFLALAILAPLIFFSGNIEIFEVPKMHFVYIVSTIILFATLIKSAADGKFLIPKNLPFFTLLTFLTIQTVSTFFSIDKFTSLFGYPSRLNGGLLSQFAYLSIFYAGLVNLNFEKTKKILIAAVLSALFVSLWGIAGHFGRDPSCLVLADQFTSDCWQEEFNPELRIFSTLGQPNWLASYLVLTLPFAISLAFIFEKKTLKNFFAATSIILFTALVMTTSRAGILGIGLGLVIMALLLGRESIRENFKVIRIIILGFLISIFLFGGFLFSRIGEIISQDRMSDVGSQTSGQAQVQAPTEPKGTESGEIRLIVWQGAIEAFKKRPILGFGPETFAYSYYLYRPLSHNQTTEWNFFYNKAHNEFLNYLTNTGVLGLLAYLIFLVSALVSMYRYIDTKEISILAKATAAAIFGYLVTIFFGFSTVASQTIMFLAFGAIFSLKHQNFVEINIREKLQTRFSQGLILLGLIVLSFPIRLFFVDLSWAKAKELEYGNTEKSLEAYHAASNMSPFYNPFIESDFAYRLAVYANVTEDLSQAQVHTKEADKKVQKADKSADQNLIVKRRIANTYLLLAKVDKSFEAKALVTGQDLIKLAPTDPQSYLTLAKIQVGLGQKEKGQEALSVALLLKPDYLEAQQLFSQLTTED